jgi:N-ethylmaleimide reductase
MDGIPTDLHAEYYAARASSGFMFTEASPISLEGNLGGAAGCWSDEQEAGWKKVVSAVHAKGGRIVLQMFHGGRTCNPDHCGGKAPLSPTDMPVPSTGVRKEG